MSESSDPSRQPPAATGAVGLYSVHGIVISTLLWSLAAAIFMLYSNYRSLGKPGLARKIAVGGGLIYLLLIAGSLAMGPSTQTEPPPLMLSLLVMAAQGAIAYFLASTLQGAAINYHREHGGLIYSNFRAVMVGLITAFALLFLLVFAVVIVASITGGISEVTPPPAPESGLSA